MSRIAQIIRKIRKRLHKHKHLLGIDVGSEAYIIVVACSPCYDGALRILETQYTTKGFFKEAEQELIFKQPEHKTYKCENQVSKYCRLIEEHPIDFKGKNVCVACYSKLKEAYKE